MGESIVITSGKGGVGKTTTTANIGVALALNGKKVVLVDTDFGLRNLDVVLGLENRVIYDLSDVCEGKCKIQQSMIKDKRFEELYLIPASQQKDKSAVTPEQMKEVILQLKQDFDYVLIDCPAGIEQGFQNAVAGADCAIVIVSPDPSSVKDADRVIGILEKLEYIQPPKLLINRVRPHMMRARDSLDIEDIMRLLSIELLGIVIDDDDVLKAAKEKEPIVMNPKSRASIAYRNIARRLLGESVPLMSLSESGGFVTKVKKFFGMKK